VLCVLSLSGFALSYWAHQNLVPQLKVLTDRVSNISCDKNKLPNSCEARKMLQMVTCLPADEDLMHLVEGSILSIDCLSSSTQHLYSVECDLRGRAIRSLEVCADSMPMSAVDSGVNIWNVMKN
jgi:hypothetical protein